jgi:hypothetical protein
MQLFTKNLAHRHEGKMTAAMEHGSSMLPSAAWLVAAGASIVGSLVLRFAGRRDDANFIGQWVPTFLLFGVYNKMVKMGRDI